MKICIKCGGLKPLDDFYKHGGMSDGHLNKCKECCKAADKQRRADKPEEIRAYDRERGNRVSPEQRAEYRKKYPIKIKAHKAVETAVRRGDLLKQPCEVCGSDNSMAHHDDYAKPLEVRWLCQVHHKEWHSVHGEGRNGF